MPRKKPTLKRRDSRPRVIGGRWKGRALEVPPRARPTSSRAREALFDVLRASIPGSRVLDLFAGSGAVGIEALSRGAISATFVESDPRILERNVESIGAGGGECHVRGGDARELVASLAAAGEKFDLVFADPPYAMKRALSAGIAPLLAPRGTFVLQTDADAAAPDLPGLALVTRRAYGRNVFFFYDLAAG